MIIFKGHWYIKAANMLTVIVSCHASDNRIDDKCAVIVPIIRKHKHDDEAESEVEAGDIPASKIKFGSHVEAGVSNYTYNRVTGGVLIWKYQTILLCSYVVA